MKHPNKGMSAVKVPQRCPELMEKKEMNGIFMRYWNVYSCSGEISCWINHWMYSCLWNLFNAPEATRSDIPPALPRLLNAQRRKHTVDFIHMLSEGWQVLNGLPKRAAILGTPLRFGGEEAGFALENTISPWRGMNVQMRHRWDSLRRDLAHGYALWTITVFQKKGAERR